MIEYIVYGAGSPIEVWACSPEEAEMHVVNRYGVQIENLVTLRKSHVMLSGTGTSGSTT